MRTIKFRGKDFLGRWHYGYLHLATGSNSLMIQVDSFDSFGVLSETIGQFAELHDKHDDEIYDGDFILSDKDNKVYYVTFKNGMFYASCHECNPNLHGGYSLWMLVNIGCSIIGNIHDNPELLKGGENE